jgi:sulfane dehydrogenase subunit SoxC
MAGSEDDAADDPDYAAGGGLLHRRALLRSGLVLATATAAAPVVLAQGAPEPRPEPPTPAPADPLAASPPSLTTPGAPFSEYGQPSPYERRVMRAVAANTDVPGNGVSWTPLESLEGIITPSGLHFERHHNGVPAIDPKQHRLMLHGLVRKPLTFSVEALLRYPMRSHLIFLECGGNSNAGWHSEPIQRPVGAFHGMVSCSEWSGIPLSTLLDEAGVDPSATWAVLEGADAGALNVSLPVAKLREDCIVALYQNGERLRPEQGYPMRLIVPGWEGIVNVKWLRRIELATEPAMTRDETAKYTELQPDGSARQFTYVMEAKSLITSPSAMQRLKAPGLYEIKGLAWSGRGRITRVDVSADGGKSWAEAALEEPVLPRCFTRFRLAWDWKGTPAVLKSRAVDETGYVQPERDVLVAERGRRGYFHYNAIVAWAVDEDGAVSHVYA